MASRHPLSSSGRKRPFFHFLLLSSLDGAQPPGCPKACARPGSGALRSCTLDHPWPATPLALDAPGLSHPWRTTPLTLLPGYGGKRAIYLSYILYLVTSFPRARGRDLGSQTRTIGTKPPPPPSVPTHTLWGGKKKKGAKRVKRVVSDLLPTQSCRLSLGSTKPIGACEMPATPQRRPGGAQEKHAAHPLFPSMPASG